MNLSTKFALPIVAFITGLGMSFVLPVMSLFLIEHLQVQPIYVGLYTIAMTTSGIAFSQILGLYADRGLNAKKIFLAATCALVIATFIFANATAFWQVLLVGTFLMGLAGSAQPQLFTIIRWYADKEGKTAVTVNSRMRSLMSASWIIGPPIAFLLVDSFGFQASFLVATALASIVVVFGYIALPDLSPKATPTSPIETPSNTRKPVFSAALWLMSIAMVCGFLANSLYITAIPLYIVNETNLPGYTAGILMGLTAGLEIPFMLMVGAWSIRFGKMRILIIASISGALFYSLTLFVESFWALIAIQVFNGIYFGVFAGLGITIIQDLMPGRTGTSSALYSNLLKTGSVLGTTFTGIIAQFLSFHAVFFAALAAISVMIALMLFYQLRQKQGYF